MTEQEIMDYQITIEQRDFTIQKLLLQLTKKNSKLQYLKDPSHLR